LRAAFSKNGGNLGETGCVSWMFSQKGVIYLAGSLDEERILEACLEGGADTYEMLEDEQGVEVFTDIPNLDKLSNFLQSQGLPVKEIEFRWIPSTMVEVTDGEQARFLLKLIDALESLDDVQSVTANFDLAEDLLVWSA
jgi:transcriptional/translational regulatory protein YebC/TACO1